MDNYIPFTGKTYTLFGVSRETKPYYQKIKKLTDNILINNNKGHSSIYLENYSAEIPD